MGSGSDTPGNGRGSDLVVVLPGVMGSSLEDRDGREIWGLGRGGILGALRTLGGSIRELTLPKDVGIGPAEDGVRPRALIPGLHMIPGLWSPIDGYAGLERFLAHPRFALDGGPAGNLRLFPYDWRLSNRWNAELLQKQVESSLSDWRASDPEREQAKVLFVAHSMGGLIARWYIEQLGGREVTRALITIGTPHRGSFKALRQLVNGTVKGFDFTGLARSLPSSYELLPEYACLEVSPGEYRKVTEMTVPHLDRDLVEAGMEFHERLNDGRIDYDLIPVVGIRQPTAAGGRLVGERLQPLDSFAGREAEGDGTVPRFSARPFQMEERDPTIRGVGDGHGALAGNRAVLDQLDLVLTAERVVYRLAPPPAESPRQETMGISAPDVHLLGEPVKVRVHASRRVLEVAAVDAGSRVAGRGVVRFGDDLDDEGRAVGEAVLEGLPPGAYTLVGRAPEDPAGVRVPPVHNATLVWEP